MVEQLWMESHAQSPSEYACNTELLEEGKKSPWKCLLEIVRNVEDNTEVNRA